eukprot:TRINITY_DN23813_c0_g2_i1.p1 TRINITY_DN23813_c0_g2~~TRINITY_DN23813_c0_g2_i1.p1  ORF type:complete len:994 (+),score=157.91 TRINITY_DN23813_c0_g2_i1:34-2982(+)
MSPVFWVPLLLVLLPLLPLAAGQANVSMIPARWSNVFTSNAPLVRQADASTSRRLPLVVSTTTYWHERARARAIQAIPTTTLLETTTSTSSLIDAIVSMSADSVKTAEFASKQKGKYCKPDSQKSDIDRGAGREYLVNTAGGDDNVVNRAFTQSANPQEMVRTFQEIDPAFVLGNGWPIALSFLTLFVFSICCWTPFPMCKCMRCFARERYNSRSYMNCCKILLSLLSIGILSTGVLAFVAFYDMDAGMVLTTCTSATLVDDLLDGNPDVNFVGLLHAMNKLQQLLATVEPNSVFLADVESVVQNTTHLQHSFLLAQDTLLLLQEMLELERNFKPSILGNNLDLLHRCEACRALSSRLPPLRQALDKGVGAAMHYARKEVARQILGEDLEYMKADVSRSIEPMREYHSLLVDTLGWFVTPGKFDFFLGFVQGTGSLLWFLIVYGFVVSLLILSCSGYGTYLVFYHPKELHIDFVGNVYKKKPIRMTCCSWNNAVLYSCSMLFIGGIVAVITVPLAGVCLLMEDFDYDLGHNIVRAIGLNISDPEDLDMTLSIADRCLSVKSSALHEEKNSSWNLMDMIKIRQPNGSYLTLRRQLVIRAIDPVNKVFNHLTSTVEAAPRRFSNLPELQNLRDSLRVFSAKVSMLPAVDIVKTKDRYKDMSLDSRTQVGLTTSLACSSYFNLDERVVGIDDFFNSFKSMGTAVSGGSCANNDLRLHCTDPSSTDTGKACRAANLFLGEMKNTIRLQATFRCNVFKSPRGSGPCDVKDMHKDAQGAWQNTCVGADGRAVVLPVYCNLEQFDRYIEQWDQRLANVFANLDESVDSSITKVNVDMRGLITGKILRPVYDVVEAFDCTFMTPLYRDLIDGMCYQGMRGFGTLSFNYVATAMLMIVLSLSMFCIWRKAHDNWEKWVDPLEDLEDTAFLDFLDHIANIDEEPASADMPELPEPLPAPPPEPPDTSATTYGARSDQGDTAANSEMDNFARV